MSASVSSRRVIISRHGYDAHRHSTVIFVGELLAPWSRVDVSDSSQTYSGVFCHSGGLAGRCCLFTETVFVV